MRDRQDRLVIPRAASTEWRPYVELMADFQHCFRRDSEASVMLAAKRLSSTLLGKSQCFVKPSGNTPNFATFLLDLAHSILENVIEARLMQGFNPFVGIIVHLALEVSRRTEQIQVAVAVALGRYHVRVCMPQGEHLRRFHSQNVRIARASGQARAQEFGQSANLVHEELVAAQRAGRFGIGPLRSARTGEFRALSSPREQVLKSLERFDPATGAADDTIAVGP